MKILLALLLSLSGFLPLKLVAQNAYKAAHIPWAQERKLTWDDFLAPRDPESSFHALSSTGINFSSTAKIHRDQVMVDFEVQCFFDPNDSWVMIDKYSPALLAHEQLHFDIAEVFARKLRRELAHLSYGPTDYQEKMDMVFQRVLAEMEDIHNRYDRETDHGLNEETQEKWAIMVEKKLERR